MGAFTIEATRVVGAPIDIVWSVVADVAGYHAVVDTLRHTEIVSGAGLGMIRHCVDTRGREWNESCTAWDPEHCFQMTVDVASYPRAFRAIFESVIGTWSLEEATQGTRITMRFTGATKLGPIGRAAVTAMGRPAVLGGILDGYERRIAAMLSERGAL